MSDDSTPDVPDEFAARTDDVDDLPTVSCTRCGRTWDLAYELDELVAGNQALEQFALDHKRHTGHFPDDAATWLAQCRHCPDGVERLSQDATRRWAERHARHTHHTVALTYGDDASDGREPVLREAGDWQSSASATDPDDCE